MRVVKGVGWRNERPHLNRLSYVFQRVGRNFLHETLASWSRRRRADILSGVSEAPDFFAGQYVETLAGNRLRMPKPFRSHLCGQVLALAGLLSVGCERAQVGTDGLTSGSVASASVAAVTDGEPVSSDPGAPLGEGFVVWESNRGKGWRIWIRDLADLEQSALRQLTPHERDRSHCCAHISPDGEWIAYLSLPLGGERYLREYSTGELRLIRPDGTGDHVVADGARTYFENRAVVWRSPEELIHIDSEGITRLLRIDGSPARRYQFAASV